MVDQTGKVSTLHSFYGSAEFKERVNGYVILTSTIGAYTFRIAIEAETYDQQGAHLSDIAQPIEVICLTREGYALQNTRWVVLGGTTMEARMVFDN
ncbi:MAG TPA: hypothetical protein VFT59_02335 [Candidatus Saccharimonadales bacterium]|nr:hypothetical protein [Candidatus Saccharimonadales bacterium]